MDRKIFQMTDYRTDVGFSALSQVESYWEALRGTQLIPNRSDIDPRGIESALEYTFILERITTGMARMRIAGSHLSDLMGMEVRGMPLTTFISANGRRQVADLLEEVFQRPSMCELRLSAEISRHKPAMEARMLLLPLKSDMGDVSRILGCMVAHGEMGRTPRRFDIVGTKLRPLIHPPLETDTPAPTPAHSETLPQFAATPEQVKKPFLRLVKTD